MKYTLLTPTLGYDLDGKSIRHQETIHCKSKSETRTLLARYIAQIDL